MNEKHWVVSYIDSLLAAERDQEGVTFERARKLLEAEERHFNEDMETALRMFHLYPHLFKEA